MLSGNHTTHVMTIAARFRYTLFLFSFIFVFLGPAQALAEKSDSFTPSQKRTLLTQQKISSPLLPVYHVPLRVHLGSSGRSPDNYSEILNEINYIWFSQAGICFDIHTVMDDVIFEEGSDLWFTRELDFLNGYFADDHDMYVIDTPDLRPAAHPAQHPAARTAAHELGHSLDLGHNQASDDNLMRSKTYGWQLHKHEVKVARQAAAEKATRQNQQKGCAPPQFK